MKQRWAPCFKGRKKKQDMNMSSSKPPRRKNGAQINGMALSSSHVLTSCPLGLTQPRSKPSSITGRPVTQSNVGGWWPQGSNKWKVWEKYCSLPSIPPNGNYSQCYLLRIYDSGQRSYICKHKGLNRNSEKNPLAPQFLGILYIFSA